MAGFTQKNRALSLKQFLARSSRSGVAPAGFVFLTDADGTILTDADGASLMEPI